MAVGLWGGLIIGLVTEYFTSNRFTPVQVGNFVSFLVSFCVYCLSLATEYFTSNCFTPVQVR